MKASFTVVENILYDFFFIYSCYIHHLFVFYAHWNLFGDRIFPGVDVLYYAEHFTEELQLMSHSLV